jgi:nicotinamide-nucleotide amidase
MKPSSDDPSYMPQADDFAALSVTAGAALKARGWLLSTAESCTGGMIAAAITSSAGSSAWFERGFVTYSNEAKIECLGVPVELIAAAGAVSDVVARAMAEGALAHSRSNASVSVTGIAGPGGATPGKPVGMVCFAWAFRGHPVTSETHVFDGDRTAVRAATVRHALQGLIDRLSRLPPA